MKLVAAIAMTLVAGAAQAATITTGPGPGTGTAITLDPADFTGSGPCGTGQSVVGDGCSVVPKNAPGASDAFGRFDPLGGVWIDSQDLSEVVWTVSNDVAFTSLTFALTDAYDQNNSFFDLLADDATWSIDERQADGNLYWVTVTFDQPVQEAQLTFQTRLNDGWGVSSATIAPIPLPAAAGLLLSGLGALALIRRRKAAARA